MKDRGENVNIKIVILFEKIRNFVCVLIMSYVEGWKGKSFWRFLCNYYLRIYKLGWNFKFSCFIMVYNEFISYKLKLNIFW